MKILILVLMIWAWPRLSRAADSLYLGPIFGATSYSVSTGDQNRQSQFSYGLENFFIHDQWAAGISYVYFSPGQQGSDAVSVNQSNHWIDVEGRYRFWNENFSPYVSVGAGGLFQLVSTTVMNETERTNGLFFIHDFGIGILGKISGDFGANLSAKYYEYSNVNGFDYFISVGFFPDLKN